MSYGSLNNSRSNPVLLPSPLSGSQAARAHNSSSVTNLQHNYQQLGTPSLTQPTMSRKYEK